MPVPVHRAAIWARESHVSVVAKKQAVDASILTMRPDGVARKSAEHSSPVASTDVLENVTGALVVHASLPSPPVATVARRPGNFRVVTAMSPMKVLSPMTPGQASSAATLHASVLSIAVTIAVPDLVILRPYRQHTVQLHPMR